MTVTVVVMILLGIAFVIVSFIISEKLTKNEENINLDLMTVDENYEFSDRELQIIKRKIEDVIATQAKDILYQTNESLSNMANEKTMALGDYAVAVCDDIEKNHKEVMFLYSMLDDKQKEIMKTVNDVDSFKREINNLLNDVREENDRFSNMVEASNNIDIHDHMTVDNKQTVIKEEVHIDDVDSHFSDENQYTDSYNDIDDTMNESNIYSDDNDTFSESVDENLDDIFAEIDKTDIDFDEVLENDFRDDANANDIVLEMYRNGHSIIEIAKELGLGVGEVKLVIDLYQGA